VSEAVASDGGEALRVHEVLGRWGPQYLERFGSSMPSRQREVLARILRCRTPALGGSLHLCPGCGHPHYSYHSCNDRHCPQCGAQDADDWLESNRRLLLPTPYFLVTFTVPEGLRAWLRSHSKLGYDLLFDASSQALQDLARHPRRLGASLGMLGVLHTWSRTLVHHPHVHYLVPGGGLSLDRRQWVPSRAGFLLPVLPLSDRYRNLFRTLLAKKHPERLSGIPARVWKQRWVVHCAQAGSGENALRYLSRYVFKTATGNRLLTFRPDGRLHWPYRDSDTGQWRRVDLEPFEFIRRFLQHVLPAGLHRVRRFGWLHPGGRLNFNRVRALLGEAPVLTEAERAAWQPAPAILSSPAVATTAMPPEPDPIPRSIWRCPHCQAPMQCVGSWRPGQTPLPPGVQRVREPP
jgi:Putative transposase/Transposase zinc-binding domain